METKADEVTTKIEKPKKVKTELMITAPNLSSSLKLAKPKNDIDTELTEIMGQTLNKSFNEL